MKKKIGYIVCLFLCVWAGFSSAEAATDLGFNADSTRYVDGTMVYPDSAIYQGMYVKLDIGSPILEAVMNKGQIQNYELALSWRIKQRFYPTWEGGYAFGRAAADGGQYEGHGGFMRLGMDLNGLKKHARRLDAMLVGIRLAGDVQTYSLRNVLTNDPYQITPSFNHENLKRFDCWGEVLAGVQVQIYAGLTMGWNIRIKILMTRTAKDDGPLPYYIPGFGFRDNLNCGFNYYIGYHF